MASNMNPFQLIGMMRNSGNPQQFILSMLEKQGAGNPLLANLLSLAQNNNAQGIEQVARNICQERGIDFDKEFKDFKQQFGL